MAVVLRLARHGQKKKPSYRVVAADKQARRDGRFIEIVGLYNPVQQPPVISLKEDKIRKWIAEGATTTLTVASLIRKQFPGLLEEKEKHQKAKVLAKRQARKARAKAAPEKKTAAKKAPAKKASPKKTAAKKAEK